MTAHRSFRLSALAGVCMAGLAGSLVACTVIAEPAPRPQPVYHPRPVYARPPPVAYAPPAPPAYQPPAPPAYQAPPLQVEVIPPPPPGSYIWTPGHWDWIGGNHYKWQPGKYVYRQAAMHQFVHGAWMMRDGNWTWVPGHWR